MKIKDLKQLMDNVNSESELAVSIVCNNSDEPSACTCDIGYEINDLGEARTASGRVL